MTKTAATICRDAGLESLGELSRLSAVPERTLNDWYKPTHPRHITFQVLVLGATLKKKELSK